MKWSLSSILRTLTWLAVGLSVLAIGLGRYAPRTLPTYQAAAVRYHGVNMHCSAEQEPQPGFLDRETGQILQLAFSPEDSLDYAICSPWRDEHGQFQAVARWMKRAGKEPDYLPQDFGVARFTVPEGRLIDRIKLDHVPVGDALLGPGRDAADRLRGGRREPLSLRIRGVESATRLERGRDVHRTRARGVADRSAGHGSAVHQGSDLAGRRAKLGGRLFASISYREDVDGKPRMSPPQLWWLQLSDDATAIEAAGRLMAPDPEDDRAPRVRTEQRLPNVVATADGDLALAYLSRKASRSLWELRVAPITIDPATGVPTVGRGRSRSFGGGFLPSTPSFSADGRWVYGIRNHDQISSQLMARRFSVTEVLAQAGGARGPPRREPNRAPRLRTSVPAAGVLREPGPPRAESTSLLGWANLGIFDPNWLVKMGAGRHAGE